MDRIDVAVVGAGVVGLAVARALAMAGREVLVLEAAGAIGMETSSRNSEVIHAGIYYPSGSLKARLCVDGRRQLYRYCEERAVPHKRLGKLIVATQEGQEAQLAKIVESARACGVDDLTPLSRAEALALEPDLACCFAVLSPSTGIIDSHAFMLALQGDAEASGAQIAFRTRVLSGQLSDDGVEIATKGEDGGDLSLKARLVVNAAGHGAIPLARACEGLPAAHAPRQFFARGCYFSMARKAPFSRLIYPAPVEGGLGVHLTLDLGGAARFGPDVEWIDRLDHTVDPARADAFYAEIRRYWPALEIGALQPAYAGVRPKISGPGEPAADFRIEGPNDHGVAGLINLFGIESPGLTASLAIADHVCAMASAR